MARLPAAAGHVATLERVLRGVVRQLRRLALVAAAGVVPVALLLRRDGFEAVDGVLLALLLVPAAVVLFFAQGLLELAGLPDRLRRIPGEGQERAGELARLGRELRGVRARRLPLLLWRLRGTIGGVRDLAGIALPLRVLTPGFLGAAALCAFLCALIALGGLVALLVLAAD
jgi:hypothetical protein